MPPRDDQAPSTSESASDELDLADRLAAIKRGTRSYLFLLFGGVAGGGATLAGSPILQESTIEAYRAEQSALVERIEKLEAQLAESREHRIRHDAKIQRLDEKLAELPPGLSRQVDDNAHEIERLRDRAPGGRIGS